MAITIEQMVTRWQSPERPLFRGSLIDADGCYCAQGDVLHCAGFTDEELRSMTQGKADVEVARLLGISRAHAVLLRNVNDSQNGCPQDVLVAPEKILGDKAHIVLAFWKYLDSLGDKEWIDISKKAGAAARAAAWAAAGAAARDAAGAAAGDAAGAAAGASNEIQGMDILLKQGKDFYFLARFGFAKPEDVLKWAQEGEGR